MKVAVLEQVLSQLACGRAVVLATNLSSGVQELLRVGQGGSEEERATVARCLQSDQCSTIEVDGVRVFYQPFNTPLRMVLVGAVHIARPLAAMASLTGYEVTIIDPRDSFASAERFPDVHFRCEWPDAALRTMALDHRTAVVTLTHDPKLDNPALQVALETNAFYIGCLGSKKTHASRIKRLSAAGWDDAALARVHGPVGLPIGSRSPAEIAVSVMAEVTKTLRKGTG